MTDKTLELDPKTISNQMKNIKGIDSEAGSSGYIPSTAESAALQKHQARRNAQTAPRLKIVRSGNQQYLAYDHPHPAVGMALFEEALGTADRDFASGLTAQLSRLAYSVDQKLDEDTLNFLFSMVRGAKPRDEMEAAIASELAAIHLAVMKAADRLEQANTLRQQEVAEKMLNKLVRAFAALVVALRCYRGGPSR